MHDDTLQDFFENCRLDSGKPKPVLVEKLELGSREYLARTAETFLFF